LVGKCKHTLRLFKPSFQALIKVNVYMVVDILQELGLSGRDF